MEKRERERERELGSHLKSPFKCAKHASVMSLNPKFNTFKFSSPEKKENNATNLVPQELLWNLNKQIQSSCTSVNLRENFSHPSLERLHLLRFKFDRAGSSGRKHDIVKLKLQSLF